MSLRCARGARCVPRSGGETFIFLSDLLVTIVGYRKCKGKITEVLVRLWLPLRRENFVLAFAEKYRTLFGSRFRSVEARSVVSDQFVWSAMAYLAPSVDPDFAANLPPTPAKRIILTQISSSLRIDDAIEKRVEIGTLHGIAPRAGHGKTMYAVEVSFRIGGNHALQAAAANQLKTTADVNPCG